MAASGPAQRYTAPIPQRRLADPGRRPSGIYEDVLDIKKTMVRDCVAHMGLSKDFETYAWAQLQQHKQGYATPRIPYLLGAALFDGRRIKLDTAYETKEEQILFVVLEHLRQEKVI